VGRRRRGVDRRAAEVRVAETVPRWEGRRCARRGTAGEVPGSDGRRGAVLGCRGLRRRRKPLLRRIEADSPPCVSASVAEAMPYTPESACRRTGEGPCWV